MKIALIAAACSPHTVKWANMLVSKGHRVTVFSLVEDKAQDAELLPEISVNYLELAGDAAGLKKNAAELKRLLLAGSFDAVNAIGGLTYGQMAWRAYAKKYVLTLLGPDLEAALTKGEKRPMKKAVHLAGAIICPSAACMQKVRSFYKKPKEIFVAAPGVDIYAFDHKPGLRDDEMLTFGCVKPLEYESGIDLLIQSFAKMKESYDGSARLLIYGQGSLEAELKRQAEQAGVAEAVSFMGIRPHSDMPEVMNTFHVYCNAARSEAFGVPTVEAMACQIPVIASDTEGSSEILLNGVTGFTPKVGNVDTFAQQMLECARNQGMRERMGKKARGDVEELYEINKCADAYEKALKFNQ